MSILSWSFNKLSSIGNSLAKPFFLEIVLQVPENNDGSEPSHNKAGEPYLFGKELGNAIVDRLLDERLIAAGHVNDDTYQTSYDWEGTRYKRAERYVKLKTNWQNRDKVVAAIQDIHPYKEVPISSSIVFSLTKTYAKHIRGDYKDELNVTPEVLEHKN